MANDASDKFNAKDLPWWAPLVFLLNMVVFLPAIVYVSYTLKHVFPILAMIEDENPPAYEPMPLNEDENEQYRPVTGSKPTRGETVPVTASIRSVHRLLRTNGGFKAIFRGVSCLIVQSIFTFILVIIFASALGGAATSLATLLASLTLVQYSTAWVHIVITPSSPLHFWQRLPPFKRTFEATWKAVTMYWVVQEIGRWLPTLTAQLFGLRLPTHTSFVDDEPVVVRGEDSWRWIIVFVMSLFCWIVLLIPVQVILVRIQASLLPVDQDAIVPFDRTFQGMVEPAVVGGKGYATVSDAWKTFTKSAWRRLVTLYAKIFAVSMAFGFLMMAIFLPQFILMAPAQKNDDMF